MLNYQKLTKAELIETLQSIKSARSEGEEERERLLHELQVHQIELEMQNQELRETQSRLEETGNLYVDLYDFAPVGYASFDDNGYIREINLTGAAVLGKERSLLMNVPFATYVVQSDLGKFRDHLWNCKKTKKKVTTEIGLVSNDGRLIEVELSSIAVGDAGRQIALYRSVFSDITERKQAEKEKEITIKFLRVVNECRNLKELVRESTAFFQQQSGFDTVGIRLREGEDYPYFETRGFPPEFVSLENRLCDYHESGQAVRDNAGNPVLECMCGNVICGRFDPMQSFFTSRGSFWSNCTTERLAGTTEADRHAGIRNRCISHGYESVALIAIRLGEECLGLLQLNDRRRNLFSLEFLVVWERLADYLAIAISKFRAEEALRESEEHFRILAETLPQMVWTTDTIGNLGYINSRLSNYTGLNKEELKEWGWLKVIHPEDVQRAATCWNEALRTGKPYENECRIRCHDGKYRWFLAHGLPLRDEEGKIIRWFGASTEIHYQKQLEQRLQKKNDLLHQLSKQVITNLEDERGAVSRELHDEAGQALIALKMFLEIMRDRLPLESEALHLQLEEAVSITGTTLERIRQLAQDLRPPALDMLGLNLTLADFCHEYSRRVGLPIEYAGCELPELSGTVSICLYRFLQEGLTNIIKHAKAQKIQVQLSYQNQQILLRVNDDGVGIKNEKKNMTSIHDGLGLIGMQERLEMLGGELVIKSKLGLGTLLTAKVPWVG